MRWFAAFVLMGLCSAAIAQEKAIGLGFSTAGSGLSGYAQASHGGFVQGLVGLTGSVPLFVLDYCQESSLGGLMGYIGGGVLLWTGHSNLGLGVHIPVGVYFRGRGPSPFMVNVDIAPGILAGQNDTSTILDVSIGFRLKF